MVEMAIAMTLLLTLMLGFVDFGYAFWQWNAANKAVQVGARMTSISTPVVSGLATVTDTAPSPEQIGGPIPTGTYGPYVCTGTGGTGTACLNGNGEFDRIFYGDDGVCGAGTGRPGMCDLFPRLQPANVRITYTSSGLGYWTRPGGPVPTITVSLEGLTFQFFFLGGLLGFNNINMPSMLSTVTGEDMRSSYP